MPYFLLAISLSLVEVTFIYSVVYKDTYRVIFYAKYGTG